MKRFPRLYIYSETEKKYLSKDWDSFGSVSDGDNYSMFSLIFRFRLSRAKHVHPDKSLVKKRVHLLSSTERTRINAYL